MTSIIFWVISVNCYWICYCIEFNSSNLRKLLKDNSFYVFLYLTIWFNKTIFPYYNFFWKSCYLFSHIFFLAISMKDERYFLFRNSMIILLNISALYWSLLSTYRSRRREKSRVSCWLLMNLAIYLLWMEMISL